MNLLPEFTEFAHKLADASGAIIRPLFRKPITIDVKADNSPVTIADREAERVMREMVEKRYPDHGIWGEEFGKHQPDAKYLWVLDPVDGTRSFIAGIPAFGVPVLGLIDQPINRERWIGQTGGTAAFNGAPANTRPCSDLKHAILSTTSPDLFSEEEKAKFTQIQAQCHHTMYGYDCYAYAQLASGFIDVVIESGLKPYDFCALRPVVEAAGGIMTDWEGKPLTLASDGRVIAAGDKRTYQQALELLQS
jgi:inositol-phosphate phosphatase/L-galactose 1-phosphate phosphatase/histidinol-phosphatase